MGIPVSVVPGRRSVAKSSAARARASAFRSLRGYARTSGYYGRFARGTGTELKFLDTTKAGTAVAAAGTVLNSSLNLVPQGADESERVGRKCTVKQLSLHGQFTLQAQTNVTNTSDRIRLIVFQDKQTNGSAIAGITDILETAAVSSFRNLANSGRFRVLMDKTMAIHASGATATGAAYTYGEVNKHWSMSIPLHCPLEFDGATGAITELRSNNIGVVAVTDGGLIYAAYTARIRYADN